MRRIGLCVTLVSTHASVRRRLSPPRGLRAGIQGFNSRLREEATIQPFLDAWDAVKFQLTPP